MNLFHQIEGEQVILRKGGTFTQTDIYQRAGELFAKQGSGYIRLMTDNKTSNPATFWDDMSIKYKVVELGRLVQR